MTGTGLETLADHSFLCSPFLLRALNELPLCCAWFLPRGLRTCLFCITMATKLAISIKFGYSPSRIYPVNFIYQVPSSQQCHNDAFNTVRTGFGYSNSERHCNLLIYICISFFFNCLTNHPFALAWQCWCTKTHLLNGAITSFSQSITSFSRFTQCIKFHTRQKLNIYTGEKCFWMRSGNE